MAYVTRKDKEEQLKQAINESVHITRILEDLFKSDASPNKSGAINCPLHADKTPSFFIDKYGVKYHCFSCGSGGKAHNLVFAGIENNLLPQFVGLSHIYNRPEILLRLAKLLSVPIPFDNVQDEVSNEALEAQVEAILARGNTEAPEPLDDLPLQMKFNRLLKDYRRGKLTPEQLLDIFAVMQHETVLDPQNIDELYTSLSSQVSGLSLSDLFGD